MSNTISEIPFAGTKEQEEQLRKIIRKLKSEHEDDNALMAAMQEAQHIYGYLPIEVQKIISEELDVFLEKIYGVATFYSQFTIEPKGEYNVQVCMGTACYVRGAGDVLKEVIKELGIESGSCTVDGKFSLQACRCIGACGLAPIITVNEDVYGRLAVEEVAEILAKYRV